MAHMMVSKTGLQRAHEGFACNLGGAYLHLRSAGGGSLVLSPHKKGLGCLRTISCGLDLFGNFYMSWNILADLGGLSSFVCSLHGINITWKA